MHKDLNFYHGLMALPKGVKEILTDLRIFIYVLIPLSIGLAMLYYSFYYGWDYSGEFVKTMLKQYLPEWISEKNYIYKSLFWLANLLAKFIFSLIIICLSFFFVQLLSIPFYSLICERILVKRKVFPNRPLDIATWIRLTLRLFVISLFRMVIFLIIGIFVFIISFVPGLQILALIYSGYVMAVDSLDYTLEIYEVSLGRRFYIYLSHFGFFMGMIIWLLPTLFIPGLTLIFLPITVVGSAVTFAEIRGQYEYEKLIA